MRQNKRANKVQRQPEEARERKGDNRKADSKKVQDHQRENVGFSWEKQIQKPLQNGYWGIKWNKAKQSGKTDNIKMAIGGKQSFQKRKIKNEK